MTLVKSTYCSGRGLSLVLSINRVATITLAPVPGNLKFSSAPLGTCIQIVHINLCWHMPIHSMLTHLVLGTNYYLIMTIVLSDIFLVLPLPY